MTKVNYKQIYAIKDANKKRILAVNEFIKPNASGIYIFKRMENGFKYAYVGQAVNLLDRLASHLSGYESHIDKSIRKHGLWSDTNQVGWYVTVEYCEKEKLDEIETMLIKQMADTGHKLLNNTTGGQGKGKKDIGDRIIKGYSDGVHKGYNKAIKEIKELLTKVDYEIKPKRLKNGELSANSLKAEAQLIILLGE